MEELQVVGQRIPKRDALDKVTGRARYIQDVKLPGMLYRKNPLQQISPCPYRPYRHLQGREAAGRAGGPDRGAAPAGQVRLL